MKAKVLKAITKARGLVKAPGDWCQGAMARNDKGHRVDLRSPDACQYCAYAALAKVCYDLDPGTPGDEAHDLHHEALLVMQDALVALDAEGPNERSIVVFNDRRKHEDVLNLFDKAIEISGAMPETEEKEDHNEKTPLRKRRAS